MSIAYARLAFLNIFAQGGACRLLAYLGRMAIRDEGLKRTFDFNEIAGDLVYTKMLMPAGAPFATPADIANALDAAERQRQRRTLARKRWPQVGAHLVVALPPDSELTLDECIELLARLVRLALGGSHSLPVYLVIHDPARKTPGAVNRHAHIFIGLREIEGAGLSRTKTRDLFAQPRHAAGGARSSYIAEGVSWPDIARDLQTSLFAEIGGDALVDPPAPFAGRHWSAKTLREAPERRDRHNATLLRQNLGLIDGPPVELVARMLRGRTLMRIDEVRRLLARFLDGDDRDKRLDAILTGAGVVTFAADPAASAPRWLTTSAVRDLTLKAARAVDRATIHDSGSGRRAHSVTRVAVAASPSAVVAELERLLSGSPSTIHRPLIIGQKVSDCGELAAGLADAKPAIGTFAALNATSESGHRLGIRRGGLVVVPCAESVPDQDLASLIVRAEQYRARLLLGFDTARASPSCSLASELVDKLHKPGESDALDPAAELRAGLVARACRAMQEAGRLRFGSAEIETRGEVDFLVVDDLDRLRSAGRDSGGSSRNAGTAARFEVDTAGGRQLLRQGGWIVYTRDDYQTNHLRRGRFARIIDARSPDSLTVIHPEGNDATLDLHAFPHIRPADAISIREARHAPQDATLLIEVTKAQHAWSAAVLAEGRVGSAVIHVDPLVAQSLDEWIAVVARSKPVPFVAALMHPRERRLRDEIRLDDWIEPFPVPVPAPPAPMEHGWREEPPFAPDSAIHSVAAAPSPSVALTEEQRLRLHEEIRRTIHANADTMLGLARLQHALAPGNAMREVIADDLLRVCPAGTPTALLVQALMGRQERREAEEFDELELPEEMTARMPRAWSPTELWLLKMDLTTMASTYSNWPMPQGPLAGRRRPPRGDKLPEAAEAPRHPEIRP